MRPRYNALSPHPDYRCATSMRWIDTHCHLDAFEFAGDVDAVHQRAQQAGVVHCVIPAVERGQFDAVRTLAHKFGHSYCLGIHPLYVPQAAQSDLAALEAALQQHHADPRLVAVGEIGLDFFVPALCTPEMRQKQEHFYRQQLRLARQFGLPVVLHVRRSADRLLKHLRELRPAATQDAQPGPWRGIAHAFNGSEVQARAFLDLGLALGFGGALTYDRALQLRRLAAVLPADAIVMETDAPDIPPHWLYATAQARAEGQAQGRNEPGELPRIAQAVAELRGLPLADWAAQAWGNSLRALPRLQALLV